MHCREVEQQRVRADVIGSQRLAVEGDRPLRHVTDVLAVDTQQPLGPVVHTGQIQGVNHLGLIAISVVEVEERTARVVDHARHDLHVQDRACCEPGKEHVVENRVRDIEPRCAG